MLETFSTHVKQFAAVVICVQTEMELKKKPQQLWSSKDIKPLSFLMQLKQMLTLFIAKLLARKTANDQTPCL